MGEQCPLAKPKPILPFHQCYRDTLFSPPSISNRRDLTRPAAERAETRAIPAASQLFVPHIPAGSRPVTPAVSIRAHEPAAAAGHRSSDNPAIPAPCPAEHAPLRQQRPGHLPGWMLTCRARAAPTSVLTGIPRDSESHAKAGGTASNGQTHKHRGWINGLCAQRKTGDYLNWELLLC